MNAKSKRILALCLSAALLAACSRAEPPAAGAPATAAAPPASTPLAPEAAVTSAAPPVGDRQGVAATPTVTPPEDRMEPASIENARLPGGGKLADEPLPEKRKN